MKTLCVYCGSNPGLRPEYGRAARALAREFLAQGIDLVYGGASVGIMGIIADTMLRGGGRVIGVMPQALVDKEVSHPELTELKIVGSMHERKALMAELSDGFIALPGGLGTLEELLEVLTWAQLGFHRKPCGLLNVLGYYDHLKSFLDLSTAEGFIMEAHRSMLVVEKEPEQLVQKFMTYEAPRVSKWAKKKNPS